MFGNRFDAVGTYLLTSELNSLPVLLVLTSNPVTNPLLPESSRSDGERQTLPQAETLSELRPAGVNDAKNGPKRSENCSKTI